MSKDLFLNLAEAGRQTAVEESNQKSLEMIYQYISIITGNDDYCVGLRAGLQCAANIINGVEFPMAMPMSPLEQPNIEGDSYGDCIKSTDA
jgi:hypothetical protein